MSDLNSRHCDVSLCIEGLPAYYTWPKVKDLVPEYLRHEVRVYDGHRTDDWGRRIRVHVVRVREDKANKLYKFLTENPVNESLLTVHFFRGATLIQSNSSQSIPACQWNAELMAGLLPRCWSNNPAIATAKGPYPAPQIPMAAHVPPRHISLLPASPLGLTNGAYMFLPSAPPTGLAIGAYTNAATSQPNAGHPRGVKVPSLKLRPDPREHLHLTNNTSVGNHQVTLAPVYVTNVTGPPVNTVHGVARTETRGVFVQGLDFNVKAKDIRKLFGKAGTIVECNLHLDNKRRLKGSATIKYTTTDEALTAVKSLDEFMWHGRMLRVRTDRERTVVEPPPATASSSSTRSNEQSEPLIVNGSGGTNRWRGNFVFAIAWTCSVMEQVSTFVSDCAPRMLFPTERSIGRAVLVSSVYALHKGQKASPPRMQFMWILQFYTEAQGHKQMLA